MIGEAALQHGLALLDEQRQALLGQDADRLSAVNARLSDWIGAFRSSDTSIEPAPAREKTADAVQSVLAALDANAVLASRSASRTARALASLVPAVPRTYTADGRPSALLPRRQSRSA